jgi:quinol monooxygenase YgiN
MSSSPAVVFATFRPQPDRLQDLRAALDIMIENTRREPGCQIYDLYESGEEDAPALHLFERYDDAEALQAHRDADYFAAYRAKLPDLLVTPVEVAVLSELDVQG